MNNFSYGRFIKFRRSVLQWYEANRANDAIVDARVEELRCIKSNHRDLDRISIRQSFIEILKNSQRRTLKEKLALTDTCDLIVESIDKNDEEKYTASLSKALPEGAADMIKEILKIRDKNHMVIKKFDIDFCVRDLITLKSPNWLNDEVINFYAQLLMYRSVKFNSSQADGKFFRKNFPTVHIFSTFFYPKLRDRGYQFVRTSTRRLNPPVLERDLILFPIHLGVHWCMAAIDMRERSITYYDSLHGNGDGCTKVLYDWIIAEAADKGFSLLGESIVDNNTGGSNDAIRPFYFDLRSPGDIPAQHNGYDCGVFSLVTAAHLCHGLSPRGFSQADMHYWRQRISFEIITGSLL